MALRTHATVLLAVLLVALACAGPACGVACGLAMPCHSAGMMADCGMSPSIHVAASNHRTCGLQDAVLVTSVLDCLSSARVVTGTIYAVTPVLRAQRMWATKAASARQGPPRLAWVLRV